MVYTTHIQTTCTKVGQCAPYRRKRERERRGSLTTHCSATRLPFDQLVSGGVEAGPAASQSFKAACGAERRSKAVRQRLRPTPRRPSSTRPSCTTPRPPATASPAASSTPTTMGLICALLALLTRLMTHVIGLWRSSRQRCQQRPREGSTCEAGKPRRCLCAWGWCGIHRAG